MLRFIPLGGFLGSGKTTTMLAAGRLLEEHGERVSIVTNDQGVDLVDSQLARSSGLHGAGEVTGGCFCCRFDDLTAVVAQLREQVDPTVVLAEAVGSCTDLQATVLTPLRRLHGEQIEAAPLSVVVDPVRYAAMRRLWDGGTEPDLAYLYRHQLDESDIIAVNKTDLLADTTRDILIDDIRARFPHADVVAYSAAKGSGLHQLTRLWTDRTADDHRGFAIDYDRYGAAEAELAWTNQSFTVRADEGLSPSAWIVAFLTAFNDTAAVRAATIGHVKVRLATSAGAAKASLTQTGGEPSLDEDLTTPVADAQATLNARVQLPAVQLATLIDVAVHAADTATGAHSDARHGDIFQPGYPVPVHRM